MYRRDGGMSSKRDKIVNKENLKISKISIKTIITGAITYSVAKIKFSELNSLL